MFKAENQPLVIMKQVPELEKAFHAMELELAPLKIQGQDLMEKAHEVSRQMDQVKDKGWRNVKEVLLKQGFIDGIDAHVYHEKGVLFQGSKDEGILGMLRQAFKQ